MRPILSTLGEKQQTFACLSGVGSIGVCDVRRLFIGHVSRKVLVFDRFIAKPEEFLREDEAPDKFIPC